ncbi:TetR/AcrR family transcriptional regulator [Cellulosimicrobium marinum]|uniref:TetR/AcrR family transcriptional regulator n=1 Tax=Cellulosimicrobium marinum TaxID=1638992 RepID=UPI001E3CFE53|nr:TetR/AcrR family transcriptional regulator [Cellulosimicrobium marinum]MCB7135809.1 TetR/AcrR family transcriptional regulator [Cellulosimicrobium marinum]
MTETALRADARRNREKIVSAATTLFVEAGADVALDAVARAAGVGIGTLYRRFPDRRALLRAVVQDAVAAVLADIRTATDDAPTAWDALARALAWSPELRVALRLVAIAPPADVHALQDDAGTQGVRDSLLALVDGLVRAAQAEGTLRPDVSAGDVVLLMAAVSRSLPRGTDDARNAYDRAHALVLDGLRAPAAHPLPGGPVDVHALPL